MSMNATKRIVICAALAMGLLAAQGPATALAEPVSAGAHLAHLKSKMRVHVVGPLGHSVGHARLSIRRPTAKRMSKTTNGRGVYTSAVLPMGSYRVTARHRGFRAASATLEMAGTGTHRMTIRLGKSATVVAAHVVHARAAHALGTEPAAAKKSAAVGKPTAKKPIAHTPPAKPALSRTTK